MALPFKLARRPFSGGAHRLVFLWFAKLAIVSLFVFAGCGPIGPIPGGALSGEVGANDVEDWSFANEVENAQLETRPADPHSVNTWFASVGSDLYVPTSMILGPKAPSERSWVTHVDEDDRVRIRLGDTVFERRARRVEERSEEYRVARLALEARYEIAVEDRDPERVIWIYRLEPRG
jgi:hypothetical protein